MKPAIMFMCIHAQLETVLCFSYIYEMIVCNTNLKINHKTYSIRVSIPSFK